MNIHKVYPLFLNHFRRKRMHRFARLYLLSRISRILDVGGSQFNWRFIADRPEIVVANLSRPAGWDDSLAGFTFETGDGTALEYPDKSFDIVYSNSVIEHLGLWENKVKFAAEVRRVGRSYYVQTPARCFPVEPHYLAPLIHRLPKRLQARLMRNFTIWEILTRPSRETAEKMAAEIGLLNLTDMRRLFPDTTIHKERFLLMTKAYVAVRKG